MKTTGGVLKRIFRNIFSRIPKALCIKNPDRFFEGIPGRIHGEICRSIVEGHLGDISRKIHEGILAEFPKENPHGFLKESLGEFQIKFL